MAVFAARASRSQPDVRVPSKRDRRSTADPTDKLQPALETVRSGCIHSDARSLGSVCLTNQT
jgi:hypothetical protein